MSNAYYSRLQDFSNFITLDPVIGPLLYGPILELEEERKQARIEAEEEERRHEAELDAHNPLMCKFTKKVLQAIDEAADVIHDEIYDNDRSCYWGFITITERDERNELLVRRLDRLRALERVYIRRLRHFQQRDNEFPYYHGELIEGCY